MNKPIYIMVAISLLLIFSTSAAQPPNCDSTGVENEALKLFREAFIAMAFRDEDLLSIMSQTIEQEGDKADNIDKKILKQIIEEKRIDYTLLKKSKNPLIIQMNNNFNKNLMGMKFDNIRTLSTNEGSNISTCIADIMQDQTKKFIIKYDAKALDDNKIIVELIE